MIHTRRLVRSVCALLLLGGCTSVHNPDLHDRSIPAQKIAGLVPHHPITLINGADRHAGTRRLAELGFEEIDGDLWQWSESAIDLVRRAIEARGGNANGAGESELILEVSDVELQQGQWATRGVVYLRVEFGGGKQKTFTGNVGSYRGGVPALDAALRAAVTNMLSDPEIQQFL